MITASKEEEPLDEVVWDLSDKSMLAEGVWFFGQAEVYERQVKFQAAKGDDVGGWVAIDDIAIVATSPCEVFPESAQIPTEGPTQGPSTSVSPADNPYFCDFEASACGWKSGAVGEPDEWFERKSARETEGMGPSGDFDNNEDGNISNEFITFFFSPSNEKRGKD